jgi:hypothetical protein
MSAWTDFVRQHIRSCPGATPQDRMRNCAKMYRSRKMKGKGLGMLVKRTSRGQGLRAGGKVGGWRNPYEVYRDSYKSLYGKARKLITRGRGVRSIMPAREGASGGRVRAHRVGHRVVPRQRHLAEEIHGLIRSQ